MGLRENLVKNRLLIETGLHAIQKSLPFKQLGNPRVGVTVPLHSKEFVMMTYIGRPLAAVTLLAAIFAASPGMAQTGSTGQKGPSVGVLTWGTARHHGTSRYKKDGQASSWGSYGVARGEREGTNRKRPKAGRD